MKAATGPARVSISDHVISARELSARLDTALAELASQGFVGPGGATSEPLVRSRKLHDLWATVAPPSLVLGPGLRGRVAFTVKRVVRRLTAWYVEPRWVGQREIDAELARFASASAATIDELSARVAQLEQQNDELQRALRKRELAERQSSLTTDNPR